LIVSFLSGFPLQGRIFSGELPFDFGFYKM
jgi:hypothetical protein